MDVEWKQITDFSKYEVSSNGDIRSYHRNSCKILKQTANQDGYLKIELRNDTRSFKAVVSRLVAQAFIPNPENKPEVDHIDRNTTNNKVDNLRWVNRNQNCINRKAYNQLNEKHIYMLPNRNKKFVVQIKRDNKIIHRSQYYTLEEAIVQRNSILHTKL